MNISRLGSNEAASKEKGAEAGIKVLDIMVSRLRSLLSRPQAGAVVDGDYLKGVRFDGKVEGRHTRYIDYQTLIARMTLKHAQAMDFDLKFVDGVASWVSSSSSIIRQNMDILDKYLKCFLGECDDSDIVITEELRYFFYPCAK